MSEVKVNKVTPRSGTTLTIGDSGDTTNVVGTLQNNGAALVGDISSVVAGTNLSGGGTSGAVTINLADASTSAKGAASFSSDNFAASSGAVTIKDLGIATAELQDDSVTYAKMQDTGTANRVLGAASAGTIGEVQIATDMIADDAVTADKLANSINSAITANTAKVTNATHSGEVTGATALTITDNIVDEANLKVSNSPTNGYFLTAQSGNTGGMTWAAPPGGGKIGQVLSVFKPARQSISSTSFVDVSNMSIAITPSASNSKILCTAFFGVVGGNGYQAFANLVRGSTAIAQGDAAGNTQRCTLQIFDANLSTTNSAYGMAMTFLDSPSTTNETTYKIQVAVRSGGEVILGGTSNTTLSYFTSGSCSFTVQEVLA